MNLLPIPLPLVGDAHPLRIHYRRYLTRSIVGAVLFHVMIVAAWILPRSEQVDPGYVIEFPPGVVIQPPPIDSRPDQGPVAIRDLVKQIVIGIPIPVDDWIVPEDLEFADQDYLSATIGIPDDGLLGIGSSGSIQWDPPVVDKESLQDPDVYIPVEEMPILITIPAPIYPELARQAGVEGTVMVRAFVGKDGRVHDAFVTESIPMLDAAALAAAKKAVFKPALQQNRPVAVWVQIPMRFVLD